MSQNKKQKKFERYRAGKVPSWALNEDLNKNQNIGTSVTKSNTTNSSKIEYKGHTADSSGVIIDTSKGLKQNPISEMVIS